MPGTELILPDDDGRLELPEARTGGARELWTRVSRLPTWLPDGVGTRQFIMAIAAEANKPELKDCTPLSVVTAAFNCAVLGLIPGQQLGHAHLVPFKSQCQLIVGYKGYLDLAYGCDFLLDVQCDVVLKGEKYRRWNDAGGAQIEHELPIERDETWNDVEAAYCIWHSRAGGRGVQVIPKKALAALKTKYGRKPSSPWNTETIAMCLKTPLRRAAKSWKTTRQLGQAVTLDDLADAGKSQPSLTGEVDATPPPSLDSFGIEPDPEADAEREANEAQYLDECKQQIDRAETEVNLKALNDDAQAGNLSNKAKTQIAVWCKARAAELKKEGK